ncbi:MAG: DNA mismatch repair endonuclease MutL [Bacteroidetes bacterium]|jgi:DNA mismatch repair protein MutL|nr:DNA mismatch repair endonuclease MutL [Bacteroidota bacterium]MBT6685366.1 DNA mismatch repair endonuclease MutL [Bacteroidota bacterium]MBT7145054.1 DNA mismatch repair endonuclease MutL [Bacteroidota bacterium]MBT7492739.1 DNA mismatch repair endonuclease MutL [Bacteroidota bacterium]
MSDIINLLPDSVANQIAAGEVIQRPASVVKELIENSIDSGATEIKVNIKDAGKTLIQVIDNGCGMSETDCRMAFERHATSKIKSANDLFEIRTMGFRGEALASIAAIARVELKTKLFDDELGTHIIISGSNVENQNIISCPNGSNFIIKNLFYNVPARRKFLKKDTTEFFHIINEFKRVALSNPEISFSLIHNENTIYNLPSSNRKLRISNIFGKSISQHLLSINTQSDILKISGFIGAPKLAKKNFGDQFFFANNRFMRHTYFHKAVVIAFENIISSELIPSYFLFLEIDPAEIDINIHPTKTEIKFEDESSIWQIIRLVVKEALGKFNIVPTLDFSTENPINIPILNQNSNLQPPSVEVNSAYNPFKNEKMEMQGKFAPSGSQKQNTANWEKLYDGVEKDFDMNLRPAETHSQTKIDTSNKIQINRNTIQIKNKYILISVKSGLMIIDQKRAHERIYYEYFQNIFNKKNFTIQKLLFPKTIELSPDNYEIFNEIYLSINSLGFNIEFKEKNNICINGVPSVFEIQEPEEFINLLIENYKEAEHDIAEKITDSVVISLAKTAAINYGTPLSSEEMNNIVDRLFACKLPNYSPGGKIIISILKIEDIENRFENMKA